MVGDALLFAFDGSGSRGGRKKKKRTENREQRTWSEKVPKCNFGFLHFSSPCLHTSALQKRKINYYVIRKIDVISHHV